MTTQHTPGQYWAEPHTATEMLILAAVDGGQEILARVQATGHASEMEANAALFAAAPAMLEALKKLQERFAVYIDGDENTERADLDADEAARAAISKAEGR